MPEILQFSWKSVMRFVLSGVRNCMILTIKDAPRPVAVGLLGRL